MDQKTPSGGKPRTDTRTNLIRAAERLFAERGLGAVSVRDITRAAGARNESALHYHFGSKEALIRAVFADRIHLIDEGRKERIARMDAEGRSGDMAALMSASIAPQLEACQEEGGRLYAAFLAQLAADPRFELDRLMNELVPESVHVIVERTADLLKKHGLPEPIARARLRQLAPVMIALVSDYARAFLRGDPMPIEEVVEESGRTLAGFLLAPV